MLLEKDEVGKYLDLKKVFRKIPMGFEALPLAGKIFIVTGTGKYFKNVQEAPENNLGIIRIAEDGAMAELLWGYEDGEIYLGTAVSFDEPYGEIKARQRK